MPTQRNKYSKPSGSKSNKVTVTTGTQASQPLDSQISQNNTLFLRRPQQQRQQCSPHIEEQLPASAAEPALLADKSKAIDPTGTSSMRLIANLFGNSSKQEPASAAKPLSRVAAQSRNMQRSGSAGSTDNVSSTRVGQRQPGQASPTNEPATGM